MQNLIDNKDKIFSIKTKVDNLDKSLFEHYIINNYEISNKATSIIMTASNRSKQTYFTLQSMLKSKNKNIQIIIVDDSDTDPININILKNYPYYIDLIVIKKNNKDWINPVVNYNIGFKFIQGDKIVIQNAEVCHVADPLYFISNRMEKDNYYVFDVKSVNNLENNEEIYKSDLTSLNIYDKSIYDCWYQHKTHNRNLHFFTAMKKETFNIIKEFSYDYSFGFAYDDDDFLLKIISNNVNIVNISSDIYNIGGIHLNHTNSYTSWGLNIAWNLDLFNKKKKYFEINKSYLDITENQSNFNDKYNLLREINET